MGFEGSGRDCFIKVSSFMPNSCSALEDTCMDFSEMADEKVDGMMIATRASFSCINVFNASSVNSFETFVISNIPIWSSALINSMLVCAVSLLQTNNGILFSFTNSNVLF